MAPVPVAAAGAAVRVPESSGQANAIVHPRGRKQAAGPRRA